MSEVLLEKLSWPEVQRALPVTKAVFIPVGAIEQHSRHLEISFDATVAGRLCLRAAQTLQELGIPTLVAPTVNYGVSWYHMSYPGTVSLSHRTFMACIKDVCTSLASHGFTNLIILNSHGGNSSSLITCIDEMYSQSRLRVLLAQWFSLVGPLVKRMNLNTPMMHSGDVETSLGMALDIHVRKDVWRRADKGRMEKHKERGIPVSRHLTYDPISPNSSILMPMDFLEDISEGGVLGDPTQATPEKGAEIAAYINTVLVELVQDIVASSPR